ncbi:MAG: hypothetical protein KA105_06095 [Caulobacter sp.]|nr:hypothetical protein [Caulobacter sp.]
MTSQPALRRLIELPGIADLETKALMKPRWAEPEARAEFPEIDACSLAIFGITADQAEETPRPDDWDGVDALPLSDQVEAFEAAGWDVTERRRPLRMLGHFNQQLWLAIRGVAGSLPFVPEDETSMDSWGSRLAADAKTFRKR